MKHSLLQRWILTLSSPPCLGPQATANPALPCQGNTICIMCGCPMNVFKHILGTINQAFHCHDFREITRNVFNPAVADLASENLNFLPFLEAQINVGFWQLNNAHVPGGGGGYRYKQKHTQPVWF